MLRRRPVAAAIIAVARRSLRIFHGTSELALRSASPSRDGVYSYRVRASKKADRELPAARVCNPEVRPFCPPDANF